VIAYKDTRIMVILKNKKIVGLFSLIPLGFLIASVLIFLKYNDKPSYSISYKEIAEKEFLVSDFSGVDAYNDLTDSNYSLLHLNYHDSIWIVKIAEKKYIDTEQVEIWALAGLKKYVLNRDKKEVCTGWIPFSQISESLFRNQDAIAEYYNNPFINKKIVSRIGRNIKEEMLFQFGSPSEIEIQELPNSYNSEVIDKFIELKYDGLHFDIYHCTDLDKEILTSVEISSPKYKLKNDVSVGVSFEKVLDKFGYPDAVSIDKMIYNIDSYSRLAFDLNLDKKIDLIIIETDVD